MKVVRGYVLVVTLVLMCLTSGCNKKEEEASVKLNEPSSTSQIPQGIQDAPVSKEETEGNAKIGRASCRERV